MIEFESISWKNFLSTGNTGVELDLEAFPSTIIVGKNGGGKSTFLDALCYNLYGCAFRNITLPKLINSVNKKNLVTHSKFRIGHNRYEIIRGMKPKVFQIIMNGEPLDEESDSRVQQAKLENQILKLDYRAFTQIVVLGSVDYVPFMQLKASSRREFIESLLDISVFSDMNELAKEHLKTLNASRTKLENDLKVKVVTRDNVQTFIVDKTTHNAAQIDELTKEIEGYHSTNASLTEQHKSVQQSIDFINFARIQQEYDAFQAELKTTNDSLTMYKANVHNATGMVKTIEDSFAELDNSIRVLTSNIETIDAELSTIPVVDQQDIDQLNLTKKALATEKTKLDTTNGILGKEKTFLEVNDTCSNCGQTIHDDFKTERLNFINDEMAKNTDRIVKIGAENDELTKKVSELTLQVNRRNDLVAAKNTASTTLINLTNTRTTNESNLTTMKQQISDHAAMVVRLIDKVMKLNDQVSALHYEQSKTEHDNLVQSRSNIESSLSTNNQLIARASTNLETLKTATDVKAYQDQLDQVNVEIDALNVELGALIDDIEDHNAAIILLKDDGAKTKIVQYYLPFINEQLNSYLEQFDFPISFVFDANFEETIRSRFRDEFEYASFSEGEKSRINIAMMFTWWKIGMLKNRNATNLLVFDEVFDGSMDVDGAEGFMTIMEEIKQKSNVVIISHKDAMKTANFDRCLEARKVGDFTHYYD